MPFEENPIMKKRPGIELEILSRLPRDFDRIIVYMDFPDECQGVGELPDLYIDALIKYPKFP
jgi:hypothetical protein